MLHGVSNKKAEKGARRDMYRRVLRSAAGVLIKLNIEFIFYMLNSEDVLFGKFPHKDSTANMDI
jgi:hypothetical protein